MSEKFYMKSSVKHKEVINIIKEFEFFYSKTNQQVWCGQLDNLEFILNNLDNQLITISDYYKNIKNYDDLPKKIRKIKDKLHILYIKIKAYNKFNELFGDILENNNIISSIDKDNFKLLVFYNQLESPESKIYFNQKYKETEILKLIILLHNYNLIRLNDNIYFSFESKNYRLNSKDFHNYFNFNTDLSIAIKNIYRDCKFKYFFFKHPTYETINYLTYDIDLLQYWYANRDYNSYSKNQKNQKKFIELIEYFEEININSINNIDLTEYETK